MSEQHPNKAKWVYVTTGDAADARSIAEVVIEERLAACANYWEGMKSLYWWKGEIQEDQECVLIFKTTAELQEKLISRIIELHPYECPCVVVVDLEGGNPAFLSWIKEQTSQGTSS